MATDTKPKKPKNHKCKNNMELIKSLLADGTARFVYRCKRCKYQSRTANSWQLAIADYQDNAPHK
jgi:lipopolysaccharide biosynthesis regulator YciM